MATLLEQITTDAESLFLGDLSASIEHINEAPGAPEPTTEDIRGILVIEDETALENAAPAETFEPYILVKTSAAGGINKYSRFGIDGSTYYFQSIGPDDSGIRKVIVSLDSAL